MDLLSITLVALALAMDCFVVAVGGSISMQSLSHGQALRASFSFGFFQFAMAILGWLAGQTVADLTMYDHWIPSSVTLIMRQFGGLTARDQEFSILTLVDMGEPGLWGEGGCDEMPRMPDRKC